jgi:hypothetical protein
MTYLTLGMLQQAPPVPCPWAAELNVSSYIDRVLKEVHYMVTCSDRDQAMVRLGEGV